MRGEIYHLRDGSLEDFADYLNGKEDRRCLFCFGPNHNFGYVLCGNCNANALGFDSQEPERYCWVFVTAERAKIPKTHSHLFYSRFMVAGDLFLEILDSEE
jgi:hypothetical protein